jgi:hypothetical protein
MKIELIMKHLYPLNPLNRKEFFALHRIAWKNGWTYSPAFDALFHAYNENWKHFYLYLTEVIDEINRGQNKNITILFGEAPPFWTGNSCVKDRTYFYNPDHINPNQTWLTIPYNYFVKKIPSYSKIKSPKDKSDRLLELAKKGVVLIDVFPFPIIQDTDVRYEVSNGFSNHIRDYFIPEIEKVLNFLLKNISGKGGLKLFCGFMAPEYTSLQLIYGKNTSSYLQSTIAKHKLSPVSTSPIAKISCSTFGSTPGELVTKSKKAKFLYRIIQDKKWQKPDLIIVPNNPLEDIPIFMSAGGSPNFYKFCNVNPPALKKLLGQ